MNPASKKEHWDSFWGAEASQRYTRISWSKIRIMKILEPFLHEGMEVLDAGCGSGFFSSFFLSKGCRVWSLDYSEVSLEIARKNTEGKCEAYFKADLFDEVWTDSFKGKFDLIFTDGLFEHFSQEDQKRLMGYFQSAKKKEGIIATFVPNRWSWWPVVRPLVMPGIQEKPFTPQELEKLHGGMCLLKTGGLSVFPFQISPEFLANQFGMILYCLAG